MFEFAAFPPPGTILRLDDQDYELRECRPAKRHDGTPTFLLDWETACPRCAETFVLTTGLKANSINRRCVKCKRPHKPVKGRRGRKLNVEIIEP